MNWLEHEPGAEDFPTNLFVIKNKTFGVKLIYS